jgi:hypothetical protein
MTCYCIPRNFPFNPSGTSISYASTAADSASP